jgi:hypothetical protein
MVRRKNGGLVEMPTDNRAWFKAVLDPMERISEVLFGLIMVLTFTSSLSIASADRASTRSMLIAALGCNLAWGSSTVACT